MPHERILIERPGDFALLRRFVPGAFETVHENLGLRGYGDLVRFLWAERMFDRRYGVRTEFLVPTEELDFADAKAREGASRYRATPPYCVSTCLTRLSERLGDLGGQMMVDYGSGAGRVMILGAEAGIGRVTGLELSPSLAAQCKQNLDAYAARFGKDTEFEILEEDAARYVPPAEATIFYFFNPFSTVFFERALAGIRQSIGDEPRDFYLLLFQTFRYQVKTLDLIGEVTGVKTYSNRLNPGAFL